MKIKNKSILLIFVFIIFAAARCNMQTENLPWDTTAIIPTEVVDYSYVGNDGLHDSSLALGFPKGGGEYAGSTDVVSLGFSSSTKGYIILKFDKTIINKAGTDFKIFENSFVLNDSYFIETATVELSLDGETFYPFPNSTDSNYPINNPNHYTGLAGINPVKCNYNDATSPKPESNDSGGDFFDLENMTSPIKESGFRYIKIIDGGLDIDDPGNEYADGKYIWGTSGFDLDAVVGINYE